MVVFIVNNNVKLIISPNYYYDKFIISPLVHIHTEYTSMPHMLSFFLLKYLITYCLSRQDKASRSIVITAMSTLYYEKH